VPASSDPDLEVSRLNAENISEENSELLQLYLFASGSSWSNVPLIIGQCLT
jgi:hypothetical protein